MSYTFDKNDIGPAPIPDGNYECTITSADEKESKNGSGNKYILLKVQIRKDVNQACTGRTISVFVFKDRDNPNQYDRHLLNRIIGTQDLEDHHKFDSTDDILLCLQGINAKCFIKTYRDEYSNSDRPRIVGWNRTATGALRTDAFTIKPSAPSEDTQKAGAVHELTDDELPF